MGRRPNSDSMFSPSVMERSFDSEDADNTPSMPQKKRPVTMASIMTEGSVYSQPGMPFVMNPSDPMCRLLFDINGSAVSIPKRTTGRSVGASESNGSEYSMGRDSAFFATPITNRTDRSAILMDDNYDNDDYDFAPLKGRYRPPTPAFVSPLTPGTPCSERAQSIVVEDDASAASAAFWLNPEEMAYAKNTTELAENGVVDETGSIRLSPPAARRASRPKIIANPNYYVSPVQITNHSRVEDIENQRAKRQKDKQSKVCCRLTRCQIATLVIGGFILAILGLVGGLQLWMNQKVTGAAATDAFASSNLTDMALPSMTASVKPDVQFVTLPTGTFNVTPTLKASDGDCGQVNGPNPTGVYSCKDEMPMVISVSKSDNGNFSIGSTILGNESMQRGMPLIAPMYFRGAYHIVHTTTDTRSSNFGDCLANVTTMVEMGPSGANDVKVTSVFETSETCSNEHNYKVMADTTCTCTWTHGNIDFGHNSSQEEDHDEHKVKRGLRGYLGVLGIFSALVE